ncbi:MAG: hypothetical protein AAGF11_23735 [Myxococcota bacterium]
MTEPAALNSNYGLAYSEWAVGRIHHALVVAPRQDIEWGRTMLDTLRAQLVNSARDLEIVEVFGRVPKRPRVFVFRGTRADGQARIHMGNLGPDEREELSYLLFLSHMPVLRCLLVRGARLFVYVDWAPDMMALFRRVLGRIVQERRAAVEPSQEPVVVRQLKLDQWILERLTLFCAQPFDDVIRQLLPDSLPLFDRREERVARLLEGIPPEFFQLEMEGASW